MPRFDLDHDHDHDHFENEDLADSTSGEQNPRDLPTPPVSGKAIASLVLSAMFCIPLLPSLLGVLFGLFSLREINNGSRTGRRLGLSGVLLGVLGLGGQLFLGAIFFLVFEEYAKSSTGAKEVATSFLRELSEGKIDEALARAIDGTPKGPLAASSKAIGEWGKFVDLKKFMAFPVASSRPGVLDFEIDGTASFAKADRDVSLRLNFDGTTFRIEQFKIAGKWGIGGSRWGE